MASFLKLGSPFYSVYRPLFNLGGGDSFWAENRRYAPPPLSERGEKTYPLCQYPRAFFSMIPSRLQLFTIQSFLTGSMIHTRHANILVHGSFRFHPPVGDDILWVPESCIRTDPSCPPCFPTSPTTPREESDISGPGDRWGWRVVRYGWFWGVRAD